MVSREGMLSMRESDRAGVIGQVAEKRLRQGEAAERLGLSVRQVKRLLARYRERGPSGLVSGRRGKPSNNAMAEAARREAMELVSERYSDFGPAFARREAGRGPRPAVFRRDAAEVDCRGRPVAGESAPGDSRAPEPSPAGVSPGLGADRRLATRLVRGSRAGVRIDRARRRRNDTAAGDGFLRRRDAPGAHGDDATAFCGPRATGGILLGPPRL